MYAVVRTGGRQVRVAPGQAVRVERIEGSVGDHVELGEVLLVSDDAGVKIGTPLVEGAKVMATITAQARGRKIRVFKMKRRTGSRRMMGHRQAYTELCVDRIEG